MPKKILILHGNRQTGELLLGRIEKLKKATSREFGWEMVAPDASPLHSVDDYDQRDDGGNDEDSKWQRTWWHRKQNLYVGLEETISFLSDLWNQGDFIGILGFSQGSRLAHIIALINNVTGGDEFNGLEFVIHASGYGDVPLPDNLRTYLADRWGVDTSHADLESATISIPSMHVMGNQDKLISPESSLALMDSYKNPVRLSHTGGHHVPVKAADVTKYLQFFQSVNAKTIPSNDGDYNEPDEEHAQTQIDEVSALSQIFPIEFKLLSDSTLFNFAGPNDFSDENRTYEHPIRYSILLQPQDDVDQNAKLWPSKQISIVVQYPFDYPDSSPAISLLHDMNYLEFSMQQHDALMNVIQTVIQEERDMPCVMSVIYAARDFFESGGLAASAAIATKSIKQNNQSAARNGVSITEEAELKHTAESTTLRACDAGRKAACNEQGLEIAYAMLSSKHPDDVGDINRTKENGNIVGKGGSWKYTIGLVGKPSAGKSTFFNAATAFARQRGSGVGNEDETIDGAAMAAHPFTTIDPNIGYCLVPAPDGSCPEDEEITCDYLRSTGLSLGSTHGRDSKGRRLISLCLKDVAGLVPGAYQGRGKGNKFLDDLTDADCLIHVVDASGQSDSEGNKITCDDRSNETNHPISDLACVRNELVEWVYFNVSTKWDSVIRRGRDKLVGMFSGYKQSRSFVLDVFAAVEKYVKDKEGRDHMFDDLQTWDEGDLHRLVSAFLGVRFPMTLALNKCDLPTAAQFITDIKGKLPIHGAHSGIALSAHKEMQFMRDYIGLAKKECNDSLTIDNNALIGVWDCLQSAMAIRAPVLVFPVNNMTTYEPLPGMTNYATRDASLPSQGMISCLLHAGGFAPSHWEKHNCIYTPFITKNEIKPALRDVLLMKPKSTVEDVFVVLKWLGALDGEFVRAEGASSIGEKPKLVSKNDVIGKQNRILRIMTTKRKTWQKK